MSELKGSTKLALGVLVFSVLWVASGTIFRSEEKKESNIISEVKKKSVRVKSSGYSMVISELSVSGKTIAHSSVVIKSEVKGAVGKIVAKEGSIVKDKQIIVELNEDNRKAKILEAKANLNLKKLEYENYSSLVAGGYSTKVKKTGALAEYEASKAGLLSAELDYEKSIIRAPFSGYLEEIQVKTGDFIDVGSTITKIINLDPIEISVYIPERYISNLALGEKTAVRANDYEFEATITFISKSALEQTRSFLVKLSAPNKDYVIAEGLSVKLSLPLNEAKAHLIKSSTLTLNDLGEVGTKVLDKDNKVHFYKVEIVREENNGDIWVSGLPDETRVITVGQEYVIEGEIVEIVVEEVK